MGVKNLFKTILENSPRAIQTATIADLSGKTVVIDLSLYLHRFHAAQGHSFTGLYHQINVLRNANITPIYVFDGEYPEEKKKTLQERKQIILNNKKKFKVLEENKAPKEERFKAKNLGFRIDNKEINFCKKLFDLLGVPWLQAKGEADILMASMVAHGKADAAMTEDADLLAFGCPVIWKKFKKSSVEIVTLKETLEGLQMDQERFQQFCILSGCDYIGTIKGVGPKTALKLLRHHSIDGILKEKNIQEYDWKPIVKIFSTVEKTRKTCFQLQKPDIQSLVKFLKMNTELSEKRIQNIELQSLKI